MSKASSFARGLKLVAVTAATIMLHLIKLGIRLITRLWAAISERLRLSITFKTTVTYTLIFSTLLLLLSLLLTGSFGAFLLYKVQLEEQKDAAYITALLGSSPVIPQDRIGEWAGIEKVEVRLYGGDSQLLFSTLDQDQYKSQFGPLRMTPVLWMDQYLHYEKPVSLSSGVTRIEVAQNLGENAQYLSALAAFLALSFLLALLLTILIGARVSRKMLRPIDNMTRTARSISVGDLNTRLDVVDSHDELKDLALTFNGMLDRIQASVDQQAVFVSDASHELRTPIAVIQGYADLIHRWGKEDKAVLEESIDAIKSESDFMQALVEKLLFLASADKRDLALQISSWPLHELVDEVIKESKMIDADHNIYTDRNEVMMINADRMLIKQALRILVDNSLKFTPAGGTIKLNSCRNNSQALLTVEDTGIGIPAEDLPHIFDRFYKSDKARTRNKGAGLGLSIAKLIVEKHRGSITAASQPGQGTKVTMTLPVSN